MKNLFHRTGLAKSLSICIAASIGLAGCTGASGQFPSFEIPTATAENGRVSVYFENVPTAQPPAPERLVDPLPGGMNVRISEIVERAGIASRAFASEAENALDLARAATDADVTSDRWAAAQIGFADLTSHHSEGQLALADLDLLVATAEANLADPNTLNDLRASQATISAALAEQAETLAAINAHLVR